MGNPTVHMVRLQTENIFVSIPGRGDILPCFPCLCRFGISYLHAELVRYLKAAAVPNIFAQFCAGWCATLARLSKRGDLSTTSGVCTNASSLDNRLCNEAVLVESTIWSDSYHLQGTLHVTRIIRAATVVRATPARSAAAVQMREHALLVHIRSGIVTIHVYAFDALLTDALADLVTIEFAAALTTNRRSLTSATRR